MGGDVRLRLDQSPVRLGNYILEFQNAASVARESCSFCNEVLVTYFRVGSQPACPSCTEKFKQERSANLARYYWRALGVGFVVAIASSLIHSALLAKAGISFGSVLIGAVVGFSIRIASRETAGVRHRITAVILTLLAGSLPLGLQKSGTTLAVLYLAIGMLAAWTIAARNVRTEIHGPFQSKTVPQ